MLLPRATAPQQPHHHHHHHHLYSLPAAARAAAAGWQQQQCRRPPQLAAIAHGSSNPDDEDTAPPPAPAAADVVVGIDLGTTNSAVAHIVDGRPVCIANALGDTLTPSVVCFTSADDPPLVGRPARAAQAAHPATTYYSVKRLIGRSWATPAVQEEAARLAYAVRVPRA